MKEVKFLLEHQLKVYLLISFKKKIMNLSKIKQFFINKLDFLSKEVFKRNFLPSFDFGLRYVFGWFFLVIGLAFAVPVNAQTSLSSINFSGFNNVVDIINALIDFLLNLAPVLAALVIVWSGYQYYFAGLANKEGALRGFYAGVVGLVIALIARAVIPIVQSTVKGGATFDSAALEGVFNSLIDALINLSLVASILVIVIGGYRYFQGGLDDTTDGKKAVLYGVLGLVFALTARAVVELFKVIRDKPLAEVPGLLFNKNGTIYPVIEAIGVALIVLSLVVSVLVIVWGGYQFFRGGIDGKADGLDNVTKGVFGLVFTLLATFIGTALFQALQQGQSTTFQPIIDGVRELLQLVTENIALALITLSGIFAVLVIVYGGYQFFFGGLGAKTEGRQNVIYGVVGLIFALLAFVISNIIEQVFTNGGVRNLFKTGQDLKKLPDNAFEFFLPAVDSIINLFVFTASVISVLVIVWGGYQYLFASEADLGGGKTRKQDGKDAIRSGIIGLVVCVIARPLAEIVDGTIGVEFTQNSPILRLRPDNIVYLVQLILGNLLIPVSSAVTIFYFVLGSYLWFTSNGSSEQVKKAKEALLNALIGFIIVLLAATIIQIIILIVQTTEINTDTPPVQEPDNSNIQVTPGDPFRR
jgi:hypothetical protein